MDKRSNRNSTVKEKLFVRQKRNGKVIEYLNKAIAFDTETTSYYFNENKVAWVYAWSVAVDDEILIGRKIEDFTDWINSMKAKYDLNCNRRMIVYAHNLPFDFSFLEGYFTITEMFASEQNRPMKVLINEVCEMRDSYILTQKKLSELAFDVGLKKLTGDLDYNLIRTPETQLDVKELAYIREDVHILKKYIEKLMKEEGNNISRIPLTLTSYVRRSMKNACYSKGNYRNYRNLMNFLTISSDEYMLLKRAFMGGYTHANSKYVNKLLYNVGSFDFNSSYPAVMCSEKFPMSKGFKITVNSIDDFLKLREDYCLIMDIKIYNLSLKIDCPDCPISISKCSQSVKAITNNGRLFSADYIELSCCDIDLLLYLLTYDIDSIEIDTCYAYAKNYLPKPIIETVLSFYEGKTTLKDVEDKIDEYKRKKGQLNSTYGMSVTDIVRDVIEFDSNVEDECGSHWTISYANIDEQIETYNKSKTRTTFYPWGIFITAYARFNLWKMILEEKNDYVYSDTDSTKCLNSEKHKEYFDKYNRSILDKLLTMCEFYGIDKDKVMPKDIKGNRHVLGYFEEEKPYSKFKTLGAKRYMVEYKNGKRSITIAGLGKITGIDFIEKEANRKGISPFDIFSNNMVVPAEYTSKMTHTYKYDILDFDVVDYTGKISHVYTYGGCHLEATTFMLSLDSVFIDFLNGVYLLKG